VTCSRLCVTNPLQHSPSSFWPEHDGFQQTQSLLPYFLLLLRKMLLMLCFSLWSLSKNLGTQISSPLLDLFFSFCVLASELLKSCCASELSSILDLFVTEFKLWPSVILFSVQIYSRLKNQFFVPSFSFLFFSFSLFLVQQVGKSWVLSNILIFEQLYAYDVTDLICIKKKI